MWIFMDGYLWVSMDIYVWVSCGYVCMDMYGYEWIFGMNGIWVAMHGYVWDMDLDMNAMWYEKVFLNICGNLWICMDMDG